VRIVVLACVVAACAHTVSQDARTGSDGQSSGARPLGLVDDHAAFAGTVTYPGGDRVDWRFVDLPARGSIDLVFRWKPPRPGLRLAVDVFDDERMIGSAKKRHGPAELHLDNVRGRLYFRIYAVGRGDAGRYKLTLLFTRAPPPTDWSAFEFPDPPVLASVPEPVDGCETIPRTALDCEWPRPCEPGAPPQAHCTCPTPPDIALAQCWATMPCPSIPDRRVRACLRILETDCSRPDPSRPVDLCPPPRPIPVIARIIATTESGSEVIVTIGRGSDDAIDRNWRADVLRGDSDQPLVGGSVVVIRVGKRSVIGKVRLPVDMLSANPRVRLTPPSL